MSETRGTFEAAAAAADRWHRRKSARTQQINAAESRNYSQADADVRLQKRVSRLRQHIARKVTAESASTESAPSVAADMPLLLEDIKDSLIERVLNETRDFLSIEYFERGLEVARATGRIVTPRELGTGFLVAPNIVLTNWHVIDSEGVARQSKLQLDYEDNFYGVARIPQSFWLDPDKFFLADKHHDFALVAVKPENGTARLSDFGYVPLIAEEGKIVIGEHINIVQHPSGRLKQIVIRDSKLVDLPPDQQDERFCHYFADTEPGSSGSPVFNDQWEVVALHHQAVPKTNEQGQIVDKDNKVLSRDEAAASSGSPTREFERRAWFGP